MFSVTWFHSTCLLQIPINHHWIPSIAFKYVPYILLCPLMKFASSGMPTTCSLPMLFISAFNYTLSISRNNTVDSMSHIQINLSNL
jgi:hypothetical protein